MSPRGAYRNRLNQWYDEKHVRQGKLAAKRPCILWVNPPIPVLPHEPQGGVDKALGLDAPLDVFWHSSQPPSLNRVTRRQGAPHRRRNMEGRHRSGDVATTVSVEGDALKKNENSRRFLPVKRRKNRKTE